METSSLLTRRRAGLALSVLAGLVVIVLGLHGVTSSPAVCGSCHEMAPRAEAWKVSPHVKVGCVACHVPADAWYSFPKTLSARLGLLGRDTVAHLTTGTVVAVGVRPEDVEPMRDEVCLRCHDVDRKATSGFRILIDHPAHAKRNGSCVSCHVTVAHPTERGTAMSFMTQCFTCHGSPKTPKASAKCTLCHPRDFQLLPGSHKPAEWKRKHGRVSLEDRRQCGMCHVTSFCDKCHGMRMPHPKGWARMSGHPASAKRDRQVCTRCHGTSPDMCTMCHHRSYQQEKGSWVKQHFIEVRNEGANFCLSECHSPVFCAGCHVRRLSQQ